MNTAKLFFCLAMITTMALAGCGGGGGNTPMGDGTPMGGGTTTNFANLNPTNARYAATAASKVADAIPQPGSITQSSNTIDSITQDRVTVTAEYGATRNTYSIRNGSTWSIGTADGNPQTISTNVEGIKGSELDKNVNGGTLWVDVYSDIEAPTTRQVPGSGGTPVRLEDRIGSIIGGLTVDETNARMGDGTLDGVAGTFSCDRAGGGSCPSFFGGFDPRGTDWIFTPHGATRTESTADTDYRAGGVWLFVPDDATSADDFVFGAFGDGSDPFKQSDLPALTGTARYIGGATGIVSARETDGTEIGYFDADVALDANFSDGSSLGTISGSLTNFNVEGRSIPGSLTLGAAPIGPSNSGFFEGNLSGSSEGTNYTGKWGGAFFGNGEADGEPGSVGGTFGGRSTDNSDAFVGAFVGYKQ